MAKPKSTRSISRASTCRPGASSPPDLCDEGTKVLTHALIKRSRCPLDPKPACKHCEVHCYHPDYRARIREIMKYSDRRLVLSGRLDLLFQLLF